MEYKKVTKNKNNGKPTLFLSYADKDYDIAHIVENKLNYETNNGIEISQYKRVPYKESFKEFMNSIPDHDFVLCIVSDNYLKSHACMYEVGEVVKDHHFREKLLFIVLGEKDKKFYKNEENFSPAEIYGSAMKRFQYVLYWKNKHEELEKKIKTIDDPEITEKLTVELKEIGNIYRNDISEFCEYLAQYNGKSFQELYENDFMDIIKWIFPDWDERMFSKCDNLTELFVSTIEEIVKVTNTDYNQIALCAKTSNYENSLIVFGDNISEKKQRYRIVVLKGVMAKSFETGNIININDVETDLNYFDAVNETKSELVVPIEIRGKIVGVINSEAETKDYYSETVVKKICRISNCLAIALDRLGYVSYMNVSKIPYVHIESSSIK